MSRKSTSGRFDLVETPIAQSADQDQASGSDRGTGNRQSGPGAETVEHPVFDWTDPVRFVQQWLDFIGLEIHFNGSLEYKDALLSAETAEEVEAFLSKQQLTQGDMLDIMLIYATKHCLPWKKTHLAPALRQIVRRAKVERRKTVFYLIEPSVGSKRAPAKDEWERVASLFEVAPAISIGVLKHVIWQVKVKTLSRRTDHHLMPVISSAIQGSGKSTFLNYFCRPLRDLVAKNAVLRQIADNRSGEIFDYMLATIDDLGILEGKDLADLKQAMTGDELNRRKLATSNLATIRQRLTLIGSANAPVSTLIRDETGHRRFVDLPYRNGNVAKGGDPLLWPIVRSLNYGLLWWSVDPFKPSPILSALEDLYKYQDTGQPIDPLLVWLCNLDLNSQVVRNITVREGVRSDPLRLLYEAQTGNLISHRKFPVAMAGFFSDEKVPFSDQIKTSRGIMVYRIKKSAKARPQSTETSSETSETSATSAGSVVDRGHRGAA